MSHLDLLKRTLRVLNDTTTFASKYSRDNRDAVVEQLKLAIAGEANSKLAQPSKPVHMDYSVGIGLDESHREMLVSVISRAPSGHMRVVCQERFPAAALKRGDTIISFVAPL